MIVDITCNGVLGCLVEYERCESERRRVALFVARESGGVPEATLIRLLDRLLAAEGVWASLKSYPAGIRLKLLNHHSRPSADQFAVHLRDALQEAS